MTLPDIPRGRNIMRRNIEVIKEGMERNIMIFESTFSKVRF